MAICRYVGSTGQDIGSRALVALETGASVNPGAAEKGEKLTLIKDLILNLQKLASSRTVWSLGDQGMVSLGNFAVNIILARNVSTTDFGTYALAFGVFLFLSGLHGSFINYPLTIRVGKEGTHAVPRLVGLALTLTAIVNLPLGIGVVALFVLVDQSYLIPSALFAFATWRFQDVLRRALMAQLKYRETVPGDAISYLGQAIAMVGLAHFDMLSLEAAFCAMGATSAAAAIFQAIQVRVLFSGPAALRPFLAICWDLGRWVVMRRLTSVVQTQGIGWVLAAVHGIEATAFFRAAVNVLAVTHPVMEGIGNLVIPSVVHAHSKSIKQVLNVTWLLGLEGGILVFPYFFALMLFPSFALGMIYGPESPYRAMQDVLIVMAAGYVMSYLARLLTGTLAGIGKPALTFHAQLYASIAATVIAIPLAALGGVYYAAVGAAISHLVRLVASGFFLRREFVREASGAGAPAIVGDTQ